jgi:hypothetical protein
VFGLKENEKSSLFAFNSALVYAIQEAPAKKKSLEFNDSKGIVGVALIYNNHRILLEGKIV